MAQMVGRLEVALLDKADARAKDDSETARQAVVRRAFGSPMEGAAPTDRLISRAAFHAGMGVLGLPQPEAVIGPVAGGTLELNVLRPRPRYDGKYKGQPDVGLDALDVQVLDAMFDKYAEDASGLLDYESFYRRVAREAVRTKHGQSESLSAQMKRYQDGLQRPHYGVRRPLTSGGYAARQKDLLVSPVAR